MRKLSTIRRLAAATAITGAVMIASSVLGGTSSVSSIEVQKNSGSASFIISKVGAVDVQEFRLEDPPRLVIDLIGAKHDLGQNKFDGDGEYVQRVRTSQFSHEPDEITRVVFDLTGELSYDVSTAERSVSVRFFAKDSSQKTAPVSWWGESSASADKTKGTPAAKPTPKPDAGVATGFLGKESTSASSKASSTQTKTETMKTGSGATAPAEDKAGGANKQEQPRPTTPPTKAGSEGGQMKGSVSPMGFGGTTPATSKDDKPAASTQNPASQAWNPVPPPTSPATSQSKPAPFTTWSEPKSGQPSMKTGAQSFPSYGASAGLARNKNITIDVQNADIKTVLRSLSEFSNTNIISGPEVEGKVTAHLKRVPWRQALDVLLKSHGFGWREEYGVIRVSTIDRLLKEELEIQAAERKKDDLLPLVTRIIPLSFANADEIASALGKVLTQRGSMQVEEGNNALVIMDIEKTVDKVQAMVGQLDRRTKQVEIVAKMVDVDYEATREIGVRWDALNLSTSDIDAVGDAVINARSAQAVGTFRVGTVQSWGQVELIIDAMEKENKANIISNPRIVTADNREANILVGKEIPLIVSDEAGNPITELTKVGIILRVTPHVNLDQTITLDLHPEVSELSAQATVQGGVIISLSEADTRVVVGDGDTAVIGGLMNDVETKLENGVPILKDIPLIGNLFKLTSKTKKKRELIIFVTPRIVDGAGG